jgi:hypothetical protein
MPRTPKIEITPKERVLLKELARIIQANPKHGRPLKACATRLNLTYDAVKGRIARLRYRYLKAREFCQEYCYWRRRLRGKFLK